MEQYLLVDEGRYPSRLKKAAYIFIFVRAMSSIFFSHRRPRSVPVRAVDSIIDGCAAFINRAEPAKVDYLGGLGTSKKKNPYRISNIKYIITTHEIINTN